MRKRNKGVQEDRQGVVGKVYRIPEVEAYPVEPHNGCDTGSESWGQAEDVRSQELS